MSGHEVTRDRIWNEQTAESQPWARCVCGWQAINVTPNGLDLDVTEHLYPGHVRRGMPPRRTRHPPETTGGRGPLPPHARA